jgi:hypothetical protein
MPSLLEQIVNANRGAVKKPSRINVLPRWPRMADPGLLDGALLGRLVSGSPPAALLCVLNAGHGISSHVLTNCR